MKKRYIKEEDAKMVVLPNAKEVIEKREEEQHAKKLISSMSKYYDAEDFWGAMGMVMFTSKKDFIINDYPEVSFKFYIVYSNVNNKLSIRYKINYDDDFNSIQHGHIWLEVRNIKIGNVLGLLNENGFLPPSIERISEINGDDIFDNLREDLRKLMYKDGEEEPTNIVKLNEEKIIGKQMIKINETKLKQIVSETIKRLLKESDNEYDYDGNYWQLIKNEYHNLCNLETKVPYHLKGEIQSMATKLQGMLSDIERTDTLSRI